MKSIRLLVYALCLCGVVTSASAQIASLSPHGELSLDIDCASCHRTEGWTPILEQPDFDHNRQTRFALTGSHSTAECSSCHLNNRFDEPTATVTDCGVCHIDVHQGIAFSETCVDCHNTTLFQEVEGIGVHTRTNFPLTGAHSQITCISCHTDDTDGAYTPLSTACVDCHQDDYDSSILVDHVAAGFPLECESCHTDLQWQGALFDHLTASSGFNLVGAHEGLACASCHQAPDLATIHQPTNDMDCISCHQADYDDEHAGSGFPVTCLDCHNQDTWDDPEDIDHFAISGGFALVGAHERISCASCHNVPDYSLIFHPANNQDCISCHQDDYNDEHAGTGIQTTCLDCHNQEDWEDVDFDHDRLYFPIFSGEHRNTWDNCQTCHLQPDNFASFSCLGACHEHTEPKMNNEHDDVRDYVYEFNACLRCHPDGSD